MNDSSVECPIWTEDEYIIAENVIYWIGGIVVITISTIGIVLNLAGVCLISKRLSKQNIFNHFIVILFHVDMIYLILMLFYVMELKLRWFSIKTFPKFIFPLCHVFFTLSIFMTLGIAYERSVAVRRPIHRRQQMLSLKYRQRSLAKHISSIVFYALVFNIPKFFELESIWIHKERYSPNSLCEILFNWNVIDKYKILLSIL